MKFVATTAAALALAVLVPAAARAQSEPKRFPSHAEEVKQKQDAERKAEEQKERERAANPPKPVTTDAEARSVAEKAAQFEKAYRERSARIGRLMAIYQKKGDQAQVDDLKLMRERLDKRHENAMHGFRQQLGETRWAGVEKHFGGPSARALEVRNEHANENAAERDARKAKKEAEGKEAKPEKKKEHEEKPKDKPKDA